MDGNSLPVSALQCDNASIIEQNTTSIKAMKSLYYSCCDSTWRTIEESIHNSSILANIEPKIPGGKVSIVNEVESFIRAQNSTSIRLSVSQFYDKLEDYMCKNSLPTCALPLIPRAQRAILVMLHDELANRGIDVKLVAYPKNIYNLRITVKR